MKGTKSYFSRCANKLGWDTFDFEILAECLPEERLTLEGTLIAEKNSLFPDGYNIQPDPSAGWSYVLSDAMCAAISERHKKFYTENPEVRKVISVGVKAYFKDNPEAGAAQGAKLKAYFAANPEAVSARTLQKNKAVNQLSMTGEFVARHTSLKLAGQAIGRAGSSIGFTIKRGGVCAGFLWEYADRNEPAPWLAKLGIPHPHSRAVNQLTKDGKFIARHDSATVAANALGRHKRCIGSAIQRGGTCGGFRWEFAEPNFQKV